MNATGPISVDGDALHSVMNQLALIVSYSDMVLGQMKDSDPCKADVAEIRTFAFKAAHLLGRPIGDAEPPEAVEQGAQS